MLDSYEIQNHKKHAFSSSYIEITLSLLQKTRFNYLKMQNIGIIRTCQQNNPTSKLNRVNANKKNNSKRQLHADGVGT